MLVQVKDLTVRFPDHTQPVITELNFELRQGERILLLGPSGSGKSTLLLALLGIVPRSLEAEVTGEVRLKGQPISELTPDVVSRSLGLLFQEPESQFCMLYPDDEVAFGLENLGVSPQVMGERIETCLKQVGLDRQQREMRIDRLSGGQQQRLALGTILAQEAELILLDEPTANLDPIGRHSVVKVAEQAVQKGKGLLVVEHNLDPWFPLLNRVLILGPDGRILDDGSPVDLFTRWGRYLGEIGVWRPRAIEVAEVLEQKGYPCKPIPLNSEALRSLALPKEILVSAIDEVMEKSEWDSIKAAPKKTEDRPVVEMINVNFRYPAGAQVLHNINLTIRSGEFWALVGPNGSGKSTLARTLIQMVEPSGRIALQGKNLESLKSRDLAQQVGYVFQNPEHQFVTDSVWEELAFSVRQLGLEEEKRRERIEQSLSFFHLEHLAAANPFTLSGGQKRRLSVATMLVGGQELLVLDEPTFGQDQRSANQLMERIAELNRSGVTVFMITHDLDLVDRYASHVAVLEKGHLTFTGSPEALWMCPDILSSAGLEAPFKIQVLGFNRERGLKSAR